MGGGKLLSEETPEVPACNGQRRFQAVSLRAFTAVFHHTLRIAGRLRLAAGFRGK
jgi:hypothetical protein